MPCFYVLTCHKQCAGLRATTLLDRDVSYLIVTVFYWQPSVVSRSSMFRHYIVYLANALFYALTSFMLYDVWCITVAQFSSFLQMFTSVSCQYYECLILVSLVHHMVWIVYHSLVELCLSHMPSVHSLPCCYKHVVIMLLVVVNQTFVIYYHKEHVLVKYIAMVTLCLMLVILVNTYL